MVPLTALPCSKIAARMNKEKAIKKKADKDDDLFRDTCADLTESTMDIAQDETKETASKLATKRKANKQLDSAKSIIHHVKVR